MVLNHQNGSTEKHVRFSNHEAKVINEVAPAVSIANFTIQNGILISTFFQIKQLLPRDVPISPYDALPRTLLSL